MLFISSLCAVAGAIPAFTPPQKTQVGGAPPKVVISELAFDPAGLDAGCEWIELAVTGGSNSFSLDGYQLESATAGLSYTFGPSTATPGDTILVALGPIRPTLAAADLSVGNARVLFTGPTDAGLLDNASEAVALRAPDGSIHDFVAYGKTAKALTSGLFLEATATGAWPSGALVDTSWNSPTPNHLGNTIGRNGQAKDTDAASDWAGNGGVDGVGGSPAASNDVDVVNIEGLLMTAQDVVNATLQGYSYHPQDALRFAVSGGDVSVVAENNQPGFNWGVDAVHTLTIEDTQGGSGPAVWQGTLTHEFNHVGARAYRLSVFGSIVNPQGDALSIQYSCERSGFDSHTIVEEVELDATLDLYGVSYPLKSSNRTTTELVGDGRVQIVTDRSETNWSTGKPIALKATIDIAQTSDAARSFSFDVSGTPFSQGLARLGDTVTIGPEVMQLKGSGSTLSSGFEDSTVTWKSATMTIDGNPIASTIGDNPVTLEVRRVSGVPGDATGVLSTTSNFPIFDAAGSNLIAEAGHQDTSTFTLQQGKYSVASDFSMSLGGSTFVQGQGFSDPPVQIQVPNQNVTGHVVAYGKHNSRGWSIAGKVAKVGGSMAIKAVCIKAAVAALVAGGLAAPETGGASMIASMKLTYKSAIVCGAACYAWEQLF